MIFSDIDHTASGAQSYQKLFQELLDQARIRNDGLNLSTEETNQIRGRIALLKELIALPQHKLIRDAQSRIEHRDE